MYLLLDQLGVNFLGPAPLDLELLHMLTTFHWNALGSTLGWWFCHNNTGGILARNPCIACTESLHGVLLLDFVPSEEPLGTPLGNNLRIWRPKLDWRGP